MRPVSNAGDEKRTALGVIGLGLAHELSSPLTTSTLALELLAERLRGERPPAADEIADEIERVLARLRRMAAVIDHLRALAAGEATGRRAPVALDDVIDRAVELLEPALRQLGRVRLARGGRDPGAVARIDALLVEQALANLILNAAEAMGHGMGTVAVAARRNGDRVRLEVTDEGPGFADPEAAKAAGYSTKRAGMGIGLALAETIARDAGGELEVGNQPEGGGRVALVLPAG